MVEQATTVTTINALGLTFAVLMCSLIFLLPRKYVMAPLLATACFMTYGQVVVVGALHFPIIRIVLLFGWMRAFLRQDWSIGRFTALDKVFVVWVLGAFATRNALFQTTEGLINSLGFAYNAIGMYFLCRFFIKNEEDIHRTVKGIAFLAIPLAAALIWEYATGRNLFYIFGGVPENAYLREETLRCQGPFAHPILAGTFGATLFPLFAGLLLGGKGFLIGSAGALAATAIMVVSGSSGPLLVYLYGIAGLFAWSLRKHMRAVRWGILMSIIVLHLVMKAPVWYLMGRMSSLVGGTGWHRADLINQAVTHFDEWWLLGTEKTSHWLGAIAPGSAMTDITSQYIYEGVNGGLLALILFILVIAYAFKGLGNELRNRGESPFRERIFLWSMGVSVFTHTMSFLSVSYFDQVMMFWFLLLAMCATVYLPHPVCAPSAEPRRRNARALEWRLKNAGPARGVRKGIRRPEGAG